MDPWRDSLRASVPLEPNRLASTLKGLAKGKSAFNLNADFRTPRMLAGAQFARQ